MPPFPLSIWHQVKVWWYGTYHRNKNCTRMLPLPYYWMKAPLVLLCLLLWDGSAQAWSTAKPHCTDHTGQGASNRQRTLVSSTALEAQEEPKRDVSTLIEWAAFNGVETTNLSLEEADSLDGCVGVTASVDTPPMTNVLKVPSSLIFSSERIQQELETDFGHATDSAVQYIESTQYRSQLSQFFLFVKVLMEHSKKQDSFWHPWFQSLPRTFDTAIAMSEEELEWLPPFAWALANVERRHLVVFCQALQRLPDTIIPKSVKMDNDLTKWAFQVVFTRAWRYPEEEEIQDGVQKEGYERCDIVPFGDMYELGEYRHRNHVSTFHAVSIFALPHIRRFNHCSEKDLELDYDEKDNFLAYTAHAVRAGAPLHISYGRPTNPYRFLTIFGFCDTGMPEMFSQITLETPTKRHQEMGYDLDTMVFRSKDGAIANAVWDVLLYTILEQKPDLQKRFYEAHKRGDVETKGKLHELFHLESCLTLKSHVDRTHTEMKEILRKMDEATDAEKLQNSRYALIRRNNEFVLGVFTMVKQRVDGMIEAEVVRRRNDISSTRSTSRTPN